MCCKVAWLYPVVNVHVSFTESWFYFAVFLHQKERFFPWIILFMKHFFPIVPYVPESAMSTALRVKPDTAVRLHRSPPQELPCICGRSPAFPVPADPALFFSAAAIWDAFSVRTIPSLTVLFRCRFLPVVSLIFFWNCRNRRPAISIW